MPPGGRSDGDVGSFPCGLALAPWRGGGRCCGPEAGAGVSGLEQESCDAQLWFENLGVLTEVAVVCPASALLVETGT